MCSETFYSGVKVCSFIFHFSPFKLEFFKAPSVCRGLELKHTLYLSVSENLLRGSHDVLTDFGASRGESEGL